MVRSIGTGCAIYFNTSKQTNTQVFYFRLEYNLNECTKIEMGL